MAFSNYYIKCNGCTFQSPALKREGFEFYPKLIQVTDSGQTASGKLVMKVLPHTRRKIHCSFPPMTPAQFRVYWNALDMGNAGESMNLTVEAYDEISDTYITDTYYHNDIGYKPVFLNGQRMIIINDFDLIGH